MMAARRIFVDTNILTYATIDVAPYHSEARSFLDALWNQGAELYISHQVIREYIVNATRPQSYSPPLPMIAVLEQVEALGKSFHILSDSSLIFAQMLELARDVPFGGKQVYDANIVATMLVNRIEELFTNNTKDFERFETYVRLIPLIRKTAL